MATAPKLQDEERRLAALHALELLDTDSEERFDRITRLAQRVFDAPMAIFTLVDTERQWFKSEVGLGSKETARDVGFCPYAILDPETTVIEDARKDERFADNPLVTSDPHIRFYAGHPVAGPEGEVLGTLCVIDDKPRARADFDAEALQEFAAMVEAEVASFSLAIEDELTGLANRRGFEMLGERLVRAARRLDQPISAIYADLDNMKPINDTYGHEAGDLALKEISEVLSTALRASDLIARLGGDEFCALLIGGAALAAPSLASRVQVAVESQNDGSESPWTLSLSLGLAESGSGETSDLWSIVAEADAEMLRQKRRKKNGRGDLAGR